MSSYRYKLPGTGGLFGQGSKMCSMNEGYMDTWKAGARTTYARVRLKSPDGTTVFTVDHTDKKFSITEGKESSADSKAVPFGTAEDCVVSDVQERGFHCPPKGSAEMDLSGTPFRVDRSSVRRCMLLLVHVPEPNLSSRNGNLPLLRMLTRVRADMRSILTVSTIRCLTVHQLAGTNNSLLKGTLEWSYSVATLVQAPANKVEGAVFQTPSHSRSSWTKILQGARCLAPTTSVKTEASASPRATPLLNASASLASPDQRAKILAMARIQKQKHNAIQLKTRASTVGAHATSVHSICYRLHCAERYWY